ncbi:hypothetical protein HZZ00_04085 [Streptomyces sp. NEAU-sy36]|uniref:hypothetical protein n=1 Tax=unclassified Streptomyces TaxID=2593676 RepID=UPI0015D57787|nr:MULTISPECIES: hypothetical protein [unclassified Streptomyces]QLJ00237.1 hypothetical protein HZZ00_04085 [Streptomyces sp. NEAU-sy36]
MSGGSGAGPAGDPGPVRRTESGTPPEAADGHGPDGWEANHAVLSHLAEHRMEWRP